MITQDEAIALAREVGAQGDCGMSDDQLTALCNAVRKKALLEAAEWFDANHVMMITKCLLHSEELRRMAEE